MSPSDVEPHFKLYIILTLVPLFSSCDVLGTINVFSLALCMCSPYYLEIRVVPVHTINTHGSGGILPFLNFSTVYTSRCTTGERALGVQWIGVFPCTASLDALEKRQTSCPPEN